MNTIRHRIVFPRWKFWPRQSFLLIGIVLVVGFSLASIFAPFLTAYDPNAINVDVILQAPSPNHLLGTDSLGRDVWARLLYGGRISLWVGFAAVGVAITIGLVMGLLAGYFGGVVDETIMRFVDVMLCFPSFFLILAVIAFLEPSLVNIMIVIGLTSWMGVARLVRADTLSLKQRDFIAASRLQGGGSLHIMVHHIVPNALGPILVSATLGVAGAILTESGLSFLGLGVQPPTASWGNMLMDGKDVMGIAPWLATFPGLAILLTVVGYNIVGEALRDRFDPRQHTTR
ncbi:ABC transporter permease [Desulfovibrio inopinatus]|uniref:ABC transporter permease n=1 Tax=Desulfovibrio inopinatus TaxID=102109 RepID=UPI0003F8C319|nr:ABC transporter permease [Desulfovibrio inopinatus]